MREKITEIIKQSVQEIEVLNIEDTSYKHLHHGHGLSKESHFEIELSVKGLNIKEKISLQKKITKSLAGLYSRDQVHSISIKII